MTADLSPGLRSDAVRRFLEAGPVAVARSACVLVALVALCLLASRGAAAGYPLFREEIQLVPGARRQPHLLLMTLGGPNYCVQLKKLASHVDASLLCADYGPDRYEDPSERSGRLEDWGDPAYDAAVAKLPAKLERTGVKVSALIVLGVSYAGFADAELVASHPEIRPAALIVVDSFLDLRARFNALPAHHVTRTEIERVVGGTPEERPSAYRSRSPSSHLAGLAKAIESGTRFVDIWSVSPAEKREFRGATCSPTANARWLSALATVLDRPLTGYVTELGHAYALWDYGAASWASRASVMPGLRPQPGR